VRRDARGRGALSTTRSDMRRVWVVIGRRVGTHAGLGVGGTYTDRPRAARGSRGSRAPLVVVATGVVRSRIVAVYFAFVGVVVFVRAPSRVRA